MTLDHWQRVFAYTTGAIVIGLLLIVFTNSFLPYVNAEGTTGYVTLLAYGFIFLNLGFGVNRRFALKAQRQPSLHYTFALLMVAPTLFWIYSKDAGLGEQRLVFALTIVFAAVLGTFFGIRRGSKKREDYLRQVREHQDESMPDDLKRSHDQLNKN